MPEKAGIQSDYYWTPAYAGVTSRYAGVTSRYAEASALSPACSMP